MSAPPRVTVHVHFSPEKGHALLSCSIYEGAHGYVHTTSALTREGVQKLRDELTVVLVEMRAAEAPAEITRPSCRECLKDTAECVCATRAAQRREAESRLCGTCSLWGRICCKLHREPVRS